MTSAEKPSEVRTRRVLLMTFPDVEVLDLCGPYEVFSVTRQATGGGAQVSGGPFDATLVGAATEPLAARNGLGLVPALSFDDAPQADVLVVPGGRGVRPLLESDSALEFLRRQAAGAEVVLSVCTGALLLAKAGLLQGGEATTHHGSYTALAELAPGLRVREDRRWVDRGQVVTAGGISAGIDAALHVVARLGGPELARTTARYMEYVWNGDPTLPEAWVAG